MNMQQAIATVTAGKDLQEEEMRSVMHLIMSGQSTPAQTGGFLIGLRMKGESVGEVSAAVSVMRELSARVDIAYSDAIDTCGTGGDGANLFNISTAAAFVVAAAGGHVAKHGNRGASSSSGSADVLEACGVNIALSPEQVARCIDTVGIGFMFAQNHHAAMKHAIGPRKELGTRTIFNLLGPMTNPAQVTRQVIGVFDSSIQTLVAETLRHLGSEHVLVLHSEDGLDEISLAAPTHVTELHNGTIHNYRITPEEFGISSRALTDLQISTPEQSSSLIRLAFGRDDSSLACSARDIIALNAGAALYTAGQTSSIKDGVTLAQDILHSGQAALKLDELINLTDLMSEQ